MSHEGLSGLALDFGSFMASMAGHSAQMPLAPLLPMGTEKNQQKSWLQNSRQQWDRDMPLPTEVQIHL